MDKEAVFIKVYDTDAGEADALPLITGLRGFLRCVSRRDKRVSATDTFKLDVLCRRCLNSAGRQNEHRILCRIDLTYARRPSKMKTSQDGYHHRAWATIALLAEKKFALALSSIKEIEARALGKTGGTHGCNATAATAYYREN